LLSHIRRTAATTQKKKKKTSEKNRNMVTPRETTLKATKKTHVSGIKQKVAKKFKQQHLKPAGKRRGKEER